MTREEAKDCVNVWKPGVKRDYAIAFVKAGLDLLNRGIDVWGPDEVPEADRKAAASKTGKAVGVPGLAVSELIGAGIVVPVGRRKSLAPSAHGRRIDTYSFTSRGVAEAWLARNGIKMQADLFESVV